MHQGVFSKDISAGATALLTLFFLWIALSVLLGFAATRLCTGWNEANGGTIACSVPWLTPFASFGFSYALTALFGLPIALAFVSGLSSLYWYKRAKRWAASAKTWAQIALAMSLFSAAIFLITDILYYAGV